MKKLLSLVVVLFIGMTALTLFGSQDRGGHEGDSSSLPWHSAAQFLAGHLCRKRDFSSHTARISRVRRGRSL